MGVIKGGRIIMKLEPLKIGYYCKFKHPKDSQTAPRVGLVVSFDANMVVLWHERSMMGLPRDQVTEGKITLEVT